MVELIMSEEKFNYCVFLEFCKKYNLSFPTDYIEYLKHNNDSELSENIVYGSDDCSIRYFYGTTSEMYSNLEDVYICFKQRMPENCVPIAETDCGNQICISLDEKTYGMILLWEHETMDVDEDEECAYTIESMPLMAKNFAELLDKITTC